MNNVLMEVNNLTTRFHTEEGVVHAVNGVSYTLNEGETLGVVGESGSGKSVHALSIMGLIPQPPGEIADGDVVFRGRNLLRLGSEDMRLIRGAEIGMVFQDPSTSLNPTLTIGLQITEMLSLHLGMPKFLAEQRAIELLDMVGIPDPPRRLRQYPHEFSGGMRQRVMIAIALSCNPQLLIADEPTTALDVTIQAQILELMHQLRVTLSMAIIWISHDLGVVARLADTVQVMYAGHIVERGPAVDVYSEPRHPYTLGLLESLPRLDQKRQKLFSIKGSPPDLRLTPPGCPFAPRCIFRVDECLQERPLLVPVDEGADGHLSACWVDVRTATSTQDYSVV